jgi:hypothetical protein
MPNYRLNNFAHAVLKFAPFYILIHPCKIFLKAETCCCLYKNVSCRLPGSDTYTGIVQEERKEATEAVPRGVVRATH